MTTSKESKVLPAAKEVSHEAEQVIVGWRGKNSASYMLDEEEIQLRAAP